MEVSLYTIFVDEADDTKYYVILEYDSDIINVKMKVLTLEELIVEISSVGQHKSDFAIQDGIFRCNSMRDELKISHHDIMEYRKVENNTLNNFRENTLYYLLARGVKENFLLIGDQVKDEIIGADDVVPFSDIKFSQGTMSVYALMHTEAGFYNKMIVVQEDTKLVFKPFRFASSLEVTEIPFCNRVGTITINSTKYAFWETQVLNIYDENTFTADCIINFCNSERNVCVDAIGAIGDYYRSRAVFEDRQSEWVGSDKSYKSEYGVYFSSSYKRMSKADREVLISNVVNGVSHGFSEEDLASILKAELPKAGFSYGAVYSALVLLYIIKNSEGAELLPNLMHVQRQLRESLFWKDLYLYRVRTKAYLKKEKITPINCPMLSGGRTKDVTFIKSVFIH